MRRWPPHRDRPATPDGARAVTRRGDTVEEAYARLRDLIIEGVYEPGQRLPQAKLMEVLRLGRTPLRNALSRLQNDGLVIATPNHGYAVAPVPISSAEEIYTLRLVVEPPLLEALAPGITRGAAASACASCCAAWRSASTSPAAFQRAHREYHMVERATFASPFIDELVINMYRHLYRHQRARLVRTRTPIDFLRLDRETVDALGAGDWLRARRALEFHLIDAAISFLADADVTHSPDDARRGGAGQRDHRRDLRRRQRAGAGGDRLDHAVPDAAAAAHRRTSSTSPGREVE